MAFKTLMLSLLLIAVACNNQVNSANHLHKRNNKYLIQHVEDNPYRYIYEIPLPEGYERIAADPFTLYLRTLELKKDKRVYLFNGHLKYNQEAQFAVLDISVGHKDLQQCADAVMRLRAEYLYKLQKYDQINFIDNNRKKYPFQPPYSREKFTQYLQQVFGFCGSASLARQLKTVYSLTDIQPGDVLIRGGFPGHAAQMINGLCNIVSPAGA